MKHNTAVLLALICCLVGPAVVSAKVNAPSDTLYWELNQFPPMVQKTPSGEFIGVEPDLMRVIAHDLDRPIVFREDVEFDSLFAHLAGGIQNARADGGAAGITIDSKRESRYDFTFPHVLDTGLQILVTAESEPKFVTIIKTVFSPTVMWSFVLFLGLCAFSGLVFWLIERKRPNANIRSYRAGVQYSFCVITTIGEGQFNPSCWITGILSKTLWFFSTAIILGTILGNVSSALTLAGQQYRYNDLADLKGKTVVTVLGTHASEYLAKQRLNFNLRAETEPICYQMMENGQADAMIFDSVALQYYANRVSTPGKFAVVGKKIDPQSYGFILPEGSSLKEAMDRLILQYHRDGTLDTILKRYGL